MRILSLLCVLATGCATQYNAVEAANVLDAAVESAQQHRDDGRDVEAAQMVTAVLRVDENYPRARALNASLAPDIAFLYDHPYLGSNVARRNPVDRSVPAQILLYLPDRILDLLDVFSFDAHVGLGLGANVHVTRAVQVGLGARATGGIGWHDHRSLGAAAVAESEFVLPGVGTSALTSSLAGTSGVIATSDAMTDFHRPSATVYQDLRDYWAIGASATAGVAGAEVDFHPVELVDFLLGWFTVDFLRDDFANTTGLDLSGRDNRLLRQITEIERCQKDWEDPHPWRTSEALGR